MKRKKENYKKAQAAMEFLMTYGWAVLIVMIVIGTLAYFGVLKPSKFLPESCFLMPGLECKEFAVTNEGVVLFIKNSMGRNLNSISVIVVGSEDNKCVGDSDTIKNLANDDLGRLAIYCKDDTPSEDSRFVSDLLISYDYGGLIHNNKGRLVYFVQKTLLGKAEKDICSWAEGDEHTINFCMGLDAMYGQGYRQSCCWDYEKCCTCPRECCACNPCRDCEREPD